MLLAAAPRQLLTVCPPHPPTPPTQPTHPQFYWVRAVTCCEDLRFALGCSRDTTEPCRGYAGECSNLRETFLDVEGLTAEDGTPTNLRDFECHAFPDSDYVSDRIVMGLIMVACGARTTTFGARN